MAFRIIMALPSVRFATGGHAQDTSAASNAIGIRGAMFELASCERDGCKVSVLFFCASWFLFLARDAGCALDQWMLLPIFLTAIGAFAGFTSWIYAVMNGLVSMKLRQGFR
jgi:hypothetical protein